MLVDPMPQLGWPQVHMISTFCATPSQWALQYLALAGGTQLQAAFPHFLGAAIIVLLGSGAKVMHHAGFAGWIPGRRNGLGTRLFKIRRPCATATRGMTA